jgi:hypothetical protein
MISGCLEYALRTITKCIRYRGLLWIWEKKYLLYLGLRDVSAAIAWVSEPKREPGDWMERQNGDR